MFKRIIVLVLDSVGIGALPDAKGYGDEKSNTLSNIARFNSGLFLPNLARLGLGKIEPILGISASLDAQAAYGKMAELSVGKDTTTGHWELMGCPIFTPFPVYPNGFPQEVINSFIQHTGYRVLGNKPASGTVIIEELGREHIKTGYPIVYTSADSVMQIAAHEEVIPLTKLYQICEAARQHVCIGKHAVGRVIARPFIGSPGNFVRTNHRHDFSLEPGYTIMDALREKDIKVMGIGKIADIFAGKGISESYPTKGNDDGIQTLLSLLNRPERGLILGNLVDFDMLYGHRNDIAGYAKALERFDRQLPEILQQLSDEDVLMITADHGCDPTVEGTDHTREYVPLIVYYKNMNAVNLGIRNTFADVAETIAENFSIQGTGYGRSFLQEIIGEGMANRCER